MNKHISTLYLLLVLHSCSDNSPSSKIKDDLLLSELNNTEIGIDFIHDASFSNKYSIYEPLGSGVAVFDYDNDGDMDVFFPQYGNNKNESKLFENTGIAFIDVTGNSGLNNIYGLIFASSVDTNNDGNNDLLIGGKNKLQLWINQGNKTFNLNKNISASKGNQFYTGATWTDVNKDGFLDAWIINYVDDRVPQKCFLTNGKPDYCPPKSYKSLTDLVLTNNKNNTFTKTPLGNPLLTKSPSLGVVAEDFNHDGLQDIYIANDGVANQLYFNTSNGFINDSAILHGAAFNMMGESEGSMGIAIGDVNNDSFVDLYVTHFMGETNTLYLNNNGFFTDHTMQSKLAQNVRNLTGFGTLFVDINTDGLLDIVAVNGSTQIDGDNQNRQLTSEPIQVWLQSENQKFIYQNSLTDSFSKNVGRGLASVDVDNDGDLDFVISNNNSTPTMLRNNSNPKDWIGFKLSCHNRTDIGAKIKANYLNETFLYKTIHTDGSYASSIDSRIIFYGAKNIKSLSIDWTNGENLQLHLLVNTYNFNQYNTITCKNL